MILLNAKDVISNSEVKKDILIDFLKTLYVPVVNATFAGNIEPFLTIKEDFIEFENKWLDKCPEEDIFLKNIDAQFAIFSDRVFDNKDIPAHRRKIILYNDTCLFNDFEYYQYKIFSMIENFGIKDEVGLTFLNGVYPPIIHLETVALFISELMENGGYEKFKETQIPDKHMDNYFDHISDMPNKFAEFIVYTIQRTGTNAFFKVNHYFDRTNKELPAEFKHMICENAHDICTFTVEISVSESNDEYSLANSVKPELIAGNHRNSNEYFYPIVLASSASTAYIIDNLKKIFNRAISCDVVGKWLSIFGEAGYDISKPNCIGIKIEKDPTADTETV